MPIFDFACDQCGHTFEKLVMSSESASPNCISCASEEVTKQVSAPAFRLSGSGWYETDFKTGKKKNLASGNETNSSNTKDKASVKSESSSSAVTANTKTKSSAAQS